MADSLGPYKLQHARLSSTSLFPGVFLNSCPLSRWCHPTISSCYPLRLLPSIFPSIRVFSNELALWLRLVGVFILFTPSVDWIRSADVMHGNLLYSKCTDLNVESESRSVEYDSVTPWTPWNSPDQNTGVGRLSLLQGIFPTQGSNRGLLHCRRILSQLSYQGSPLMKHPCSIYSIISFKPMLISHLKKLASEQNNIWEKGLLY